MTVRERLLAIRLAEKLDRDPGFAQRIGVRVEILEKKERKDRG